MYKRQTHKKIIADFQEHIVDTGKIELPYNYEEKALSINKQEPSMSFAKSLLLEAEDFLNLVVNYRATTDGADKQVVESYYKA